jgi:hypothetical protein
MALCPLIIFILHFCIFGCIFYSSSCSACLHACFMLILRFLTKETRVLLSFLAFFYTSDNFPDETQRTPSWVAVVIVLRYSVWRENSCYFWEFIRIFRLLSTTSFKFQLIQTVMPSYANLRWNQFRPEANVVSLIVELEGTCGVLPIEWFDPSRSSGEI